MCLHSSRPPPSLSVWKLYSATSGSFSILYCYLSHWCDNPGGESKGTFFPCEEQKSSFSSWRGTETCCLKTGSWLRMIVCFAALFFSALVTFWSWSLHVRNGLVVKGLSPLPTLLGQWLYSTILLKTWISETLMARSWTTKCSPTTSLLRHGWTVVVRKLPLRLS